MSNQRKWNINTAKQHYQIKNWSRGYFDINASGNVVAKTAEAELDIYSLSKELRANGINLPTLVRFPQILQQSLHDLCTVFKQAIQKYRYSGKYIPAYPIKVNQQATIIQHFQKQSMWPVAYEVGTKAELIACLGVSTKQQTIICNGYKDENYIRLALLGGVLGHEVTIVLENINEFKYVLKHSQLLNINAKLGIRVRLSSIAKGNWQNTGGKYSKFGLTPNEVLALIEELRANNVVHWMKMLHFHMGSQIPCLQDIQSGISEGMQYYSQLTELGIKFEQLNIGGGLAVDYEGSTSNNYFSMAYSLNDYADIIVQTIKTICVNNSLPVPTILSENGRAMTAYHAILLTNVIDVESHYIVSTDECERILSSNNSSKDLQPLIKFINLILDSLKKCKESTFTFKEFKKISDLLDKLEYKFMQGKLSLSDRAVVENLVSYTYKQILTSKYPLTHKEKQYFEDKLVAKYFCNFSLFQSTPDIWGLKQIFPILPLHRLQEYPRIKSRIYDLTCDSDGRIDHYVENGSISPYLSLHEYQSAQDYVLGIFLVGAYQEILGDMHNLFGNTNAVNIVMNVDGSYQICDEEPGDTVEEILSYLHINTDEMHQLWLKRLSENNINESTQELLLSELKNSLGANSYLA